MINSKERLEALQLHAKFLEKTKNKVFLYDDFREFCNFRYDYKEIYNVINGKKINPELLTNLKKYYEQ